MGVASNDVHLHHQNLESVAPDPNGVAESEPYYTILTIQLLQNRASAGAKMP